MSGVKAGVIFGAILACFVFTLCLLPLDSSVQIGADEGYEMAKATLSLKGYRMYTQVWNDQPPLHTYLIAEILRHVSPSIAGPRLLSSGLAAVLLGAFFYIGVRIGGLLAGSIATIFLLSAPVFLELSASCMVEIPAMAPAVVAIALLVPAVPGFLTVNGKAGKDAQSEDFCELSQVRQKVPWDRVLVAGALLGVSFQIKFINIILTPLLAVVLWLRFRGDAGWRKSMLLSVAGMAAACGVTFVVINQVVDGQGLMVQFRQSWAAHFASAQSFEYGSPADHPFDWRIMVRNWDTSIPALAGLVIVVRRFRRSPLLLIAGVWLVVNLTVFAAHKPWWSCYYLHIAVPLSLCAGLGGAAIYEWARGDGVGKRVFVGVVACCVAAWVGSRIFLEVRSIRSCPQISTALFLEDIARYKPFVEYIYCEEPVYSFHADIPMPPEFAVVALKRLWTGDMTNEKIARRMREIKPGLMLLSTGRRLIPFQALLDSDYQLLYQDESYRLFALKSVVQKAFDQKAEHKNANE